MPRRDQVDSVSLAALLIVVVLATLVFFLPRSLTAVAGRDAWLAVLVNTPVVALVLGAWYAFYLRPGLTLLDRLRGHPWARWLLLPVLVAYALYHAGGILGETVMLMVVVYAETPVWAFHGTLALTAWVLAAYGRETLARVGLMVLPVMVAALFVNLAILLPGNAEWAQLLPMLEHGHAPLVRGAGVMAAAAAETLLLAYFADGLASRDRRVRPLVLAAAGMIALLAGVTAACVAVLGPGETTRAVAPTFVLARLARPVPVLSRPEIFTISAWLLGIALKLALFVYVAGVTLRVTLGLTERRQGLVHATVTAAAVAVAFWLFPDTQRWEWQFTRVWPLVGWAGLAAGTAAGLLPVDPRRRGDGSPSPPAPDRSAVDEVPAAANGGSPGIDPAVGSRSGRTLRPPTDDGRAAVSVRAAAAPEEAVTT